MFGFVSKLLVHKQLVFEEGRINLFGENIYMFPAYCMVDTLKELEKSNSETLLYKSFRELGIKWTKNLIKNYKVSNLNDLIQTGSGVIALAGYGVVKTDSIDKENHLIKFNLEKSSLAEHYGKSDHAIDHLFRGMATGFMCVAFNDYTLQGVETKCLAMGNPFCEVIIKPESQLDFSNSLIQKQIGLKD